MDPLTITAAISTATAAFGGIKKAFMAGRELESMTQDLSRWMGAVSDVANIEKRAKNPTLFSKVFNGQSIEQEAIEAFAAKKKLDQQRDELKTFIMFAHGTKAWDELIQMEGQIRKRRQKEVYEAQERKEKILFWTIGICTFGISIAILVAFAYGLLLLDRST
jgi:nitrate reductase NapE component